MIYEQYYKGLKKEAFNLFLNLTLSEKLEYLGDLLSSDRDKNRILEMIRSFEIRAFNKYRG